MPHAAGPAHPPGLPPIQGPPGFRSGELMTAWKVVDVDAEREWHLQDFGKSSFPGCPDGWFPAVGDLVRIWVNNPEDDPNSFYMLLCRVEVVDEGRVAEVGLYTEGFEDEAERDGYLADVASDVGLGPGSSWRLTRAQMRPYTPEADGS